jgi:hypothetical protein
MERMLSNSRRFNLRLFQGCDKCGGLCSVLAEERSVRTLEERNKLYVFTGQRSLLNSTAQRGCLLSELLVSFMPDYQDGNDRVLDLALLRVDGELREQLHTVALLDRNMEKGFLNLATSKSFPKSVSGQNTNLMN